MSGGVESALDGGDKAEEIPEALGVGVVEVSRDGEHRKTAKTLTGASETNPKELGAVLCDAQKGGIDTDAVLSEMDRAAEPTKGAASRFLANIRNWMDGAAKPTQRSAESNKNEERTARDVVEDLKRHQSLLGDSEEGFLSWDLSNEARYYVSRSETDPQDVVDLLDSMYNIARQGYCIRHSPAPSSDLDLGMSRLMKEADEYAVRLLFELLEPVSACKIHQIKNLLTKKERFEYLLKRASEYSRATTLIGRVRNIRFQAKLAGYDSTAAYFDAGERGEVDTGDLTRIETSTKIGRASCRERV